MAYNEVIANKVRVLIAVSPHPIEEKAMFGGLCFMVNNKMCVGVEKDRVMLRINPLQYEELLEQEGCKPMDFTGRVMKGYVFVDCNVLNTTKRLSYWVNLALVYNEIAKPSVKRKK